MSDIVTGREIFARAGLAEIPKLLTLQDRNRHSPTYGCFDRNYWHYKVIDFPSGMAQEFVWPLALAATLDLPGNVYRANEPLREWIRAGILYAARSSHSDGSCDDYFPFERALGAAAFSLLACAEAYRLIGMQSDEALAFFQRRARWLVHRRESGRLSNHHALVALGLEAVDALLPSDEFRSARDERITQLLSWQNSEGWFPEYEGFDPGYDTLTLSCLALLHHSAPDIRMEKAIRSSVSLLANFVHPDGSFGGEYGSRNTYNFFPHGFELAGHWLPEALAINDRFLAGLKEGRGPCYSDDRIIGHHAWNYLLAARDHVTARPGEGANPREPGSRMELKEAGIVIDRRETTKLYLALKKGGNFKLFRDEKLILSDTGLSLRMRNGKTAVMHLPDKYICDLHTDRISVRGAMGWAKQEKMTPFKLIVLRLINLSIGRLAPDLVRSLLQKLLITGKQTAPFHFARTLEWDGERWKIVDRIKAESWQEVEAAGVGPDQTSTYVAMSRTFQRSQLQPWIDLTGKVRALKNGEPLIIERIV
jgi:hypothetical protein